GTPSNAAWVPAPLTELSLERLGETAPFDAAIWAGASLAKLSASERGEILRRMSLCLSPQGRAIVEYSHDEDYNYASFQDDLRPAGLVPDVVFGSWDLKPQMADAQASLVLLSRR